ncbi:histidine kinase dimerization/phosphoacceptor domain -containing protein [Candidatus Magnetominusculus dajiuhuensis]|uniref:histidine kinase dimerization/phosphoacceptor domain -containing protein n=1 Tax=Candidatus Magnetominusculus dajiuhuensis TaxID=3137712 RepID=UPI003B434A13
MIGLYDDDKIIFRDDGDGTLPETTEKWKILIVDDEQEVHQMTKLVLNNFVYDNKPLEFLSAYSGAEADRLITENPDIAVILLDIVMEDDHSGLNVTKFIREELKNNLVRIILRTGQPGQMPKQQVIVQYDINGYMEKGSLTSGDFKMSLLLALKTYRDIVALNDNKTQIEKAGVENTKTSSQLTTLLASIKDMISIKDISGGFVLVNNAFREFIGLGEEEIIGKTYENFFPPAFAKKERESDREVLETLTSVQIEQVLSGSEGNVYLETIKNPIYTKTGEVFGCVAVSRDITERKLNERRLQEINEQLNMEIERRQRVEKTILSSLKEKEILLKEVHHRVKNNLQIISSLLYLQSINLKNVNPQEVLSESHSRIRSMALVHEKLYKSGNLATIDFGQYIRELASDILYSFGVPGGRITLNMKCASILLDVETSIPCGLIVNELVSNAVKYAFPGNTRGAIHISLDETPGGMLRLVIGDTGVGVPKDVDIFNSDSLGLKLVNNLVKQIKGTLELTGSGGTEFMITFQKTAMNKEQSAEEESENGQQG